MRAVLHLAVLWAASLLLTGCWLFEDEPPPVFAHSATAIPQQPPAAPTAEDAAAGHASPVTPVRDQRNRVPSITDMKRDLRARVSIAAPRQNAGSRAGDTVSEERLTAIAADDREFFEELNKETNTWPEAERNRRAQALNSRYADYLSDNPDDVEALILYGKFLRAAGERALAFEVFIAARELNSKIAVVHQQIGNYFAEEGKYHDAYQSLLKARTLAPEEAIYHYQLGELLNIYYDKFLDDKSFTTAEVNALIVGEFARAAELAPQEPGFAWRRAECYYDMREPDWNAALAAWETLARKTNSPVELEIIRLHRGRVLLELGRRGEARPLIEQPVHRALEASRTQLAQRLASPAAPPPTPAPTPGS